MFLQKIKLQKKLHINIIINLWIDRNEYTPRMNLLAGLIRIKCVSNNVMPVSGEVNTIEDIQEYWRLAKMHLNKTVLIY